MHRLRRTIAGKVLLSWACALLWLHLSAQKNGEDSSLKYVQLNEVVFSANKFSEKKKNVAQKIDVISKSYIARMNAQNTGDLLMSTGNVFVQKSQQGGSSPVIRGFEASRVLLVVDGVRMNNLIYRSGHLQNVITVDQNMLETVEVLYGPASTLYGSDALGGVLHFRSKAPKLSTTGNTVSGLSFVRYSSANAEKVAHIQLNIGGKKFGWLQSATFNDFGDMKMGDNYPEDYPDFGRRSQYVANINRVDSVVTNPDDRVQKFSGYRQWDIMQKFLFQPNERTRHSLNLQFSNTTDVPRYDRLQDIRNGTFRYAEWYYGPQLRLLGAYEFEKQITGFMNSVRLNLNYQHVEESRHTRDYRAYDRLDRRWEEVQVAGLVLDAIKKWKQHELTVGTDLQLNTLQSTAARINTINGARSPLDTRYPDGDNRMNYFGVFAQHVLKMSDGKWVLNDGIRLQTVRLHSTIENNSFFNLPFTEIHQNNHAVTGNIGLIYLPDNNTKVSVSAASGFRTPNVDDLAKIFESSTAASQVVVPNADIEPEYTYNLDGGISHLFAGKIKVELVGFHTWFKNAIVKAPFTLNGEDSIDYNGVYSQVLASQNRNKAKLYGMSASLAADITEHLSIGATFNYMEGYYQTREGEVSSVYRKQPNGEYALVKDTVSRKPLDHIPPVFGKISAQYRAGKLNTEIYLLYNGWKDLDDYNADGEDNPQYATKDGMPGWMTLNFRASLNLISYLQLQIGVENILDRNYRQFASGFSSAGRNFVISVRLTF